MKRALKRAQSEPPIALSSDHDSRGSNGPNKKQQVNDGSASAAAIDRSGKVSRGHVGVLVVALSLLGNFGATAARWRAVGVPYLFKTLAHPPPSPTPQEPDGWFLKFQNKALSTEMFGLKRKVAELCQEREDRRRDTREALSHVSSFSKAWLDLELTVAALLGDDKVMNKIIDAEIKASKEPARVASSAGSTGASEEVESSGALLDRISRVLSAAEHHEAVGVIPEASEISADLSTSASHLAKRSLFISSGISALLTKAAKRPTIDLSKVKPVEALQYVEKAKQLESQVAELTKTRDEANSKARRANRKLDKIAAGVAIDEVMNGDDRKSGAQSPAPATPSNSAAAASTTSSAATPANAASVPTKEMEEVVAVSEHRKKKIEELEGQMKNLQLQLNESASARSTIQEHQVRSHGLFISQASSLARATANLKIAQENVELVSKKYAEIQGKHEVVEKALRDLTAVGQANVGDLLKQKQEQYAASAAEVAKLKFKLGQAIEGAKQSNSYKTSLAEMRMSHDSLVAQNSKLQKRNEELPKSKKPLPSSHNPKKPPPVADLLKENQDLRGQIADADNLMNEIDSLEQERDLLAKTNARLQRQVIDKEDMNNNLMSEIMKMKQLNEQASKEVEALQTQAKKADEISSASRAVEAMSRSVEQELSNKTAQMESLEAQYRKDVDAERQDRLKSEAALSEQKNSMATFDASISEVKNRNDALVKESADVKLANNRLEEELVAANLAMKKAEQKVSSLGGGGGGTAQAAARSNL